jgi:hypothetical protein
MSACQSRQTDNEVETIHIDFSDIQNISLPSGEVKRIALQSDSIAMLDRVNAIIEHDEILYIRHGQRLSRFSSEGEYLGDVARQGRAANEYIDMWDVFGDDSSLYIFDYSNKKIVKYDYSDHALSSMLLTDTQNVINSIQPYMSGYVCKMGFWGFTRESPELGYFDENFKFVKLIGDSELTSGIAFGRQFSLFDDTVLYWRPLGTEIFGIDENLEIKPRYLVDFGERSLPVREWVDENETIEFVNENLSRYATLINNVVETDSTVGFTFASDSKMFIAVYDKRHKKSQIYTLALDDNEMINVIISYGDKVYIVTESVDSNGYIYTIDIDNL